MRVTDKDFFDLAIIGAGPAGCAAALGLGRSGLKVTLIDRYEFPRDKICGDAIPGPAIKALSKAFPFFEDEFKKLKEKQRITASRIMLKNGRSIDYNWKLPAYNIKRSVFDDFLLSLVKKYTRIDILSGFKVDKILPGPPHIVKSSERSLQARLIIGCYGTSDLVQQPAASCQKPVFALRAYYSGLNLDATTNYFYVLKNHLPGYFWIFPLPSGEYNVGFGMQTGRDGKVKANMNEVLQEFVRSKYMEDVFAGSQQLATPQGAFIPVGGKKLSYSGDGYMLAGDAAKLADPLQGHGIDKAVVSGLLAAHMTVKCFMADDFSSQFLSEYDMMITGGLGRELKKNYRKMQLLKHFPFLLNLQSGKINRH